MGYEENIRDAVQPGAVPAWFKDYQAERLKEFEAEKRALADAKADANAVWALADFYIPADVREFAERHKIPELASELWRGAFIAGWRARERAEIPE